MPSRFQTKRSDPFGRFAALDYPDPLPMDIERRLMYWVMGVAALVLVGGVAVGWVFAGEVHPVAWLAAGALAWAALFFVFHGRRLGVLVLGASAMMGMMQIIVRDPRSFPVAVTILIIGLMVAFPYTPGPVRMPALAIAVIVLLLIAPTGGPDLVSSYAFSLVTASATYVGYRLLGGLEVALRRAEDDSRALLEVVDRAPIVGMVVDFSTAAQHIGAIRPEELEDRIEDSDFLLDVYRSARLSWVNETARREFRLNGDASTVRLGSDVPPPDVETIRRLVQAVRDGDRYVTSIAEVPGTDGESRWFYSNWVVPPERLDRCVLVASEVTEVVRAREQLERLVDDKNRFLATISHELRTPLTAVLGFAREAVTMTPDGDEATKAEYLELVVEQAEEMSFIIEDLLTAARADAGSLAIEPRPVDIGELATRLAVSARTPVDLEVDGDVVAMADPVRVRQILRNLISNAARYGGSSRSVRVLTEGSVASIEVANDGPPVPPDMVEAIFEPYVSAHVPAAVTGSIGLGLAVSRQLARLMGGDLGYFRREETTVFRLTLPAAGPRA